MSGNKAVELQIQMRQNAEDLQNFMKELNNWEEEVKKKDQQLRTGNISEPPVKLWDSEQTQYRVRCLLFFFLLKMYFIPENSPAGEEQRL